MTHKPEELAAVETAIGKLYGYSTAAMARSVLDALVPFRAAETARAIPPVPAEPGSYALGWSRLSVDDAGVVLVEPIPDSAVYLDPPSDRAEPFEPKLRMPTDWSDLTAKGMMARYPGRYRK
jgi:hypothetical protein